MSRDIEDLTLIGLSASFRLSATIALHFVDKSITLRFPTFLNVLHVHNFTINITLHLNNRSNCNENQFKLELGAPVKGTVIFVGGII